MTPPRELRVGDRVRDNDPRMRGTTGMVLSFGPVQKAVWTAFSRTFVEVPGVLIGAPGGHGWRTRIRLDRIDTSGKPRRSGWSLVTP